MPRATPRSGVWWCAQREAAFAAKRVIVVVEEVVPEDVVRARSEPHPDPLGRGGRRRGGNRGAAHPSFVQGYYDRDNAAYLAWDRITRDPAKLERYLDEWVHGLPDRTAYLSRLGEETRGPVTPGSPPRRSGGLRGLPVTADPSAATRAELMVFAACREVRDGGLGFVGVGLPNLAVQLALRLHAPRCHLIYESGVFGARPVRLPISIGDPCLVSGAAQVLPMAETFLYFLQGGAHRPGFSGRRPDWIVTETSTRQWWGATTAIPRCGFPAPEGLPTSP